MINTVSVLVVIALPAVLNLPTSRSTIKRSPLDIRSSFDELPRLFIPSNAHHGAPLALAPILAPHKVVRLHHGVNIPQKLKGPNVDHNSHHHLFSPIAHIYPQAMSKVHKVSVHTNFKHVLTQDNVKIPFLTHTISHSSSNITHTPLLPVQVAHGILVPLPKPLALLHDTSVIPLHHGDRRPHYQQLVTFIDRQDRQRSEPITADSDDDNDYARNPIGGFGTGLAYGGQGAGHGYYAYG